MRSLEIRSEDTIGECDTRRQLEKKSLESSAKGTKVKERTGDDVSAATRAATMEYICGGEENKERAQGGGGRGSTTVRQGCY